MTLIMMKRKEYKPDFPESSFFIKNVHWSMRTKESGVLFFYVTMSVQLYLLYAISHVGAHEQSVIYQMRTRT